MTDQPPHIRASLDRLLGHLSDHIDDQADDDTAEQPSPAAPDDDQ